MKKSGHFHVAVVRETKPSVWRPQEMNIFDDIVKWIEQKTKMNKEQEEKEIGVCSTKSFFVTKKFKHHCVAVGAACRTFQSTPLVNVSPQNPDVVLEQLRSHHSTTFASAQ